MQIKQQNKLVYLSSQVLLLLLAVLFISCEKQKEDKEVKETEEQAIQKFEPTIESLQNYECPEWFRDAKFGIYMHWGVYSVAEQGEWYARRLYDETRPEYQYHLKTYGHPSKFGYKDFIPMWKAENFDPDTLVSLFKKAGAKYFTPCAVHHDNFDLWDSKYHRWNAAKMGPKKDLVGMWREATLKQGLRFGVTTHLSRSYSWMNLANQSDTKGSFKDVPYDGDNPEYDDFYFKKHEDKHQRAAINPPKEWRDLWAKRIKDLIDNYHPDLLYFDCAVPFRGDDKGETGMNVISHLYNHSIERHNGKQEAVMNIKERPWQGLYAEGMATLDFERGKASGILKDPWQTDDSLGPWGYKRGEDYMSADATIDKLIDIVSKNGNLLLNVPIKADGTLDKKTTDILLEIGEWLVINGEAIYGTRPWYMFGSGPHNDIPHKVIKSPYNKRDIRFTTKEDTLYAFVLDWPGAGNVVELPDVTLMNTRIDAVDSVVMLGYDGKVVWEQHPDGLRITMPDKKPCDNAYTFKIEFKK
ncbi:alpha-L-fucosidase [Flavivirga amylovorans]|uniref:alpha-L-fucosidase n=1 Tax=Flavivirga amylovorans TaxID=870486 RepID=A0ABT8WY28_9FLAO|nr:alpha-L-fucosidase [Flavivirga amylovorans]MDO5986571.1 alpha-L-fucosidase [Flavivirga amylovorans]